MPQLAEWADKHGFKFTHIVLDRGISISQPMITTHRHGAPGSIAAFASDLSMSLWTDGFRPRRIKIEVGLDAALVPADDLEGAARPDSNYFEYHFKLLLDGGADLRPLREIAQRHHAHVSRNNLKTRDDGTVERFVTLRCHDVGRETADRRSAALRAELAEYEIVEYEAEYVVSDDNLALDDGWIDLMPKELRGMDYTAVDNREEDNRLNRSGLKPWQVTLLKFKSAKTANTPGKYRGYPNTYSSEIGSRHTDVFAPELKQYGRAMKATVPVFTTDEQRAHWHSSRSLVAEHILALTSTTAFAENLLLRGSLLMKYQVGDQAREPGDIDWVFRPSTVKLSDSTADDLVTTLLGAIEDYSALGGIQMHVDGATIDDIWTYDRAAGRRLVIPWLKPKLPSGFVQIDIVFGEDLWTEPVAYDLPLHLVDGSDAYLIGGNTVTVYGASMEQSLAWKLLWLQSDLWPQGKDLYDAVLLAVRCRLPRDLFIRAMIEGNNRDPQLITARTVEEFDVDWPNFLKECPYVVGTADDWKARLVEALEHSVG